MHDDELIASAIVLSHEEQRERLRLGCPQAVPRSHVVGDPCADQIRASTAFRDEYRAALGIAGDVKLVLLTSTWGPRSLLGAAPDIIRRSLAELPCDEYRVIAAIHPNAWYGHGAWQLRSWLEPYVRAGLLLPSPAGETWKAAICAADAFVGDHGSLTLYSAAHGLPGLLASFDHEHVAAGSPMERLGTLLPSVLPHRPLSRQIEQAMGDQIGDEQIAATAELLTSHPGSAQARLRRLCYDHLGLAEPSGSVAPRPVALPLPTAPAPSSPVAPPLFADTWFTEGEAADHRYASVRVRRYPAAIQARDAGHVQDAHVVVEEGEPDPRWSNVADIVVARRSSPDRLFTAHPGCSVVASANIDGGHGLALRDGRRFVARPGIPGCRVHLGVIASAFHAWLHHQPYGEPGEPGEEAELLVDCGSTARSRIRLRRVR